MISSSIVPLIRIRIAAAVTLTALAGFLLAAGPKPGRALAVATGVFLLAACGSILNQVQDRRSDALMSRTCRRPLVTGCLTPRAALLAALLSGTGGLSILLLLDRDAAIAGILALSFYNGLYTPLKKLSFLALLPGALCGSMAPAIGWLAGGGRPADYRMVLMCGLLLLWQVPHFWLFALKNRADLERAGLFPGLPMSPTGHTRGLILVWMLALVAGTLLLPAFRVVPLLPVGVLCLMAACWPIKALWLKRAN